MTTSPILSIQEFRLGWVWKTWFSLIFLLLLFMMWLVLKITVSIEYSLDQFWWALGLLIVIVGLVIIGYGIWYSLDLITCRIIVKEDRIIYRNIAFHRELAFTEIKGYQKAIPTGSGDFGMFKIRELITIISNREKVNANIFVNQYIAHHDQFLDWLSANFPLLPGIDRINY